MDTEMKVRIECRGVDVWDRLYHVMERTWEKYAVVTKAQVEYATTFLKTPPPDSHLRESFGEEFPNTEIAA